MPVTVAQKRAAAELAKIAYRDEANPGPQRGDIAHDLSQIPAAAHGPWTLVWGPAEMDGILAYVARSNDAKPAHALAFRGSLTELAAHDFLYNWVLNGDTFRQVPWNYPKGGAVKVSSGMNSALAYAGMLTDPATNRHVLDFLRDTIAKDGSLDLLVTGHSLGGALTQLASLWLHSQLVQTDGHRNVGITPLTFAAPTCGNQQFATLFETTFPDNYALVNTLDIVPMAWADLDTMQHQYPPPAQTVAEFGVGIAALLAIYKDSLAQAYRPIANPPRDTFRGWMPAQPDKFEHTAAENHTMSIYYGHVTWVTGIP
jgi:triacylglycerol lipase